MDSISYQIVLTTHKNCEPCELSYCHIKLSQAFGCCPIPISFKSRKKKRRRIEKCATATHSFHHKYPECNATCKLYTHIRYNLYVCVSFIQTFLYFLAFVLNFLFYSFLKKRHIRHYYTHPGTQYKSIFYSGEDIRF